MTWYVECDSGAGSAVIAQYRYRIVGRAVVWALRRLAPSLGVYPLTKTPCPDALEHFRGGWSGA